MTTKYSAFFNKKFDSFLDFEKNVSLIDNDKLKGDIFEQFIKIYFELNKKLYQLKNIYLLTEAPIEFKRQLKLEKTDYGVDAIAEREDGELVTIQIKFRSNRDGLTHRELSTFNTEGGCAKYKYIVSNCYDIPASIKKHDNIFPILFDTFKDLDADFFTSVLDLTSKNEICIKKASPRKHQKEAIEKIVLGFKGNDRGKYISACGTGKTLTALWVMEELSPKFVLFLVPSLALIKQTLESWVKNTQIEFNYLCVCSDDSVSNIDSENMSVQEIGVPVTTNSINIANFIVKDNNNKTKIIFSTYQSLIEIKNSINKIKGFEFDIIFFDEAHRTAGIKESSLFNLAVDNDSIKSKKRLFMTATERILTPKLKSKLEDADRVVFSMDDPCKYGPTFERLSFGKAISLGIISDYKIIISAIKDKEIYDLIKNNNYLKVKQDEKEKETTAINLFKQLLLVRAIKKYKIKKTIVFNSDINSSKSFISKWSTNIDFGLELRKELKLGEPRELSIEHMDGTMSTGERTKIFESFENHNIGILSNAKCLTEGVDLPIIDGVYFAAPKTSVIDIVQACGRALRKDNKSANKIAHIIIPIFYNENQSQESYYSNLYYVVQALRDQDERLADYIDNLNFNLAQKKPITISNKKERPIEIIVSKEIDLQKFKSEIDLKIAEHNPRNINEKKYVIEQHKGYLKSGSARIFKTVGDYQIAGYKSLVDKTLAKYSNQDELLDPKQLQIDHNNISHTRRLELIELVDKKYQLTNLGKEYYNKKISFEEIFKKIMLTKNNITEYPYITVLKILKKVKKINFIQFLYGIYTLTDESNRSINNAVKIITELQSYNYNLLIAKEQNRIKLLDQLNRKYYAHYNDVDLIMKNTIGNQFKYLGGHLSLFSEIIEYDSKEGTIYIKSLTKLNNLIKD